MATATLAAAPRRLLEALSAHAGAVDAATPPDRDRLIDLLRVTAMLVVALGHWVAAAVTVAPDGSVTGTNVLEVIPGTQWLTLLLQVMGLFFATSAWSSARSLSRHPEGSWYLSRLRRIAAPTAVYVAVWTGLTALLVPWVPADTLAAGAGLVAVQLWFVAVIVLMFALTPVLHRLWRRHGLGLAAALAAGALAVDVAHRVAGVPLVGWLNFALVWSVPTVLGFAWHDGHLSRRRARGLLAGGAVATALLVASPWLPLSMVGVPGAEQSNNLPPSVALIALTCVHLGAVLLAADRLRAWLARPLVWAGVVAANRTAMTTYLWHLTALVVLVAVLVATGGTGWLGAVGSARWWLTRPLWLAMLILLTAPLILVFRRVEHARLPAVGDHAPRLVVATVGLVAGAGMLAMHGFAPAGQPVSVWALAVLAGAAAVRAWPSRSAVAGDVATGQRAVVDPDVAPAVGRLHDPTVTDVHGHVVDGSAEEHQVARGQLGPGDATRGIELHAGAVRQ